MATDPSFDGPRMHVFARKETISSRLFRQAFGVYLVFAVALTSLLVAEVFLSAKGHIGDELAGHEKVFHRALSLALWDIDVAQIDALARGILDVPVIDRVRIVDPASGRVFADIHKGGAATDEEALVHRFPIRFAHAGGATTIGEAELHASNRTILARVQRSVGVLVLLAFLKTAAMFFVFRFFARRLVHDPLAELANAALESAPGATGPIDMTPQTRRRVKGTEFETLRDAYNALVERVEMNRQRFATLSRDLEREVERRTRELQSANEQLGELAATDPLTLLANRRGFDAFGAVVLAQAQRKGAPVALLVLDIDHFKTANDTFGHDAGDRVLQSLAHTLQAASRTADVAARVGGDEFVLLLPETDAPRAAEVAERLRAAVESSPVMLASGIQIRITASIGMATSLAGVPDLAKLLRNADHALYEAKRNGRNRVQAFDETLAAVNSRGA